MNCSAREKDNFLKSVRRVLYLPKRDPRVARIDRQYRN